MADIEEGEGDKTNAEVIALEQPSHYYLGCNQALLRAVPSGARRILDVGCAGGRLGAALKQGRPDRTVFGIERQPEAAALAARCLDQVFTLDIAQQDPPLESRSLDCLLFGDVLEHLIDPESVLRRFRRFLVPGGVVLASIPNIQHHTILAALLSGDFQYVPAGLLDATHLRFFTGSTMLKLFLDAGYEAECIDAIRLPAPPGLAGAARPLLDYLGLHPGRTLPQLDVYQHIVQGRPIENSSIPEVGAPGIGVESVPTDAVPLSFVTCVSDESILQANLLASPCLHPGSPHDVGAIRGASSAAAGLNQGLEWAEHELVVCVHQDVYLPRGWDRRLVRRYRLAEARFGPIGVAGVYGVGEVIEGPDHPPAAERIGWINDRGRPLRDGPELPARVATLDELLLIVPRGTPLRFDPALGFHLYGADLCLQAQEHGLAVVALDVLCYHNSRSVGLPPAFFASGRIFARMWEHRLPIATPCAIVDRTGKILVLGNPVAEGPATHSVQGRPLLQGG